MQDQVERAWTPGPDEASDWHHPHHLGTPQQYTYSGPAPDLLSQTWSGSPYLYFIKPSFGMPKSENQGNDGSKTSPWKS